MTMVGTKAQELFDSLSWPSAEEEAWRRTDLRRLLPKGILDERAGQSKGAVLQSGSTEGLELDDSCAARVVMEQGIVAGLVLSDKARSLGVRVEWVPSEQLGDDVVQAGLAELDQTPDRIIAWHWRDMGGALRVQVPGGVSLDEPIIIEERVESAFAFPHVDLDVGGGAFVNVIWSLEAAGDAGGGADHPVVNTAITARIGQNARADVTMRQNLGVQAALFAHGRIEIERDSRLNFLESHLGGSLVKTRTRAVIRGEGSETRLKGVYVVGEGRHMDIGTLQEHHSPHAFSDALYKGAVHPGGRTVYAGLIEVAAHASKTDAYLTNNNLVLGDGARTDSLPQLNILTDDVKCSHGSTTGKLNEEQLFYLRSRGFSPEEAVRELSKGFLSEVLDSAPEFLAPVLEQDLERALLDGGE